MIRTTLIACLVFIAAAPWAARVAEVSVADPKGLFRLVMRLYLPDPEVLEHKWKLPPLERVK